MIKTWDVQPEDEPRREARRSPQSPFRENLAALGRGASAPAPKLAGLSEAQWGRWCNLVKSSIDNEELLREIRYVEENLPLCASCRLRSATVHDHGHIVCASCLPSFGDVADQAWSDHKEREMAP